MMTKDVLFVVSKWMRLLNLIHCFCMQELLQHQLEMQAASGQHLPYWYSPLPSWYYKSCKQSKSATMWHKQAMAAHWQYCRFSCVSVRSPRKVIMFTIPKKEDESIQKN